MKDARQAAPGLDVNVRGLERVICDGSVRLDLVELPVPGFLVDGSNEAVGRAVFLKPFVNGITITAGDPDIEGDAVLMLRGPRRRRKSSQRRNIAAAKRMARELKESGR
jgi:hypothetical protein